MSPCHYQVAKKFEIAKDELHRPRGAAVHFKIAFTKWTNSVSYVCGINKTISTTT